VDIYGNGVFIGADGVRSERDVGRWSDGAKREGERGWQGLAAGRGSDVRKEPGRTMMEMEMDVDMDGGGI